MRIAMVGTRGIPARSGGIERVVQELSGELSSRGHQVLVYARGDYLGRDTPAVAAKVIVTAGMKAKHLDTFTHTATAMFDVLGRKVDVVHVHSPGPALLSWVAALAGLPVVLTIHAADWRRDKWCAPAKAMIRAGLVCGMRVADAVTAVSQPLAEELSRDYGKAVTYVPNAVGDVQPREPAEISAWGLKPDGFALYVGRIVPEKRLHLLLEAWATCGADVPLVVVGDWRESRYSRACRRRAGRNVLFVGPRYGATLAELYSSAALVVQPSVLEGMSLVLLEAAAYGRCVLAARIPANVHALGEAAAYFAPDDLSELACQIGRCLGQEEFRRLMGARARAFVRREYSWQSVAGRMEEVYRQAVAAAGGKR